MRNIYPVKYYSAEGFVEHKIELGDEGLEEIIRKYLKRHADFDFVRRQPDGKVIAGESMADVSVTGRHPFAAAVSCSTGAVPG